MAPTSVLRPLSLFLVCLAASLAVPTLFSSHTQPQTVFSAEWLVPWLMVLAVFAVALRREGRFLASLGGLGWGLGGLVCVLAVSVPGGGSSGYVVYAGLLLLAYVFGSGVGRIEGSGWIALGLLGCAVLQSLVGMLQLAGVEWNGLILRKIYLQAFGNVGQANHYADLIYLGMASLGWLWAAWADDGRRKSFWLDVGGVWLTVFLAVSAAFSASRGVWLYILGFVCLGAWGLWRGDETGRRFGRNLLVIALISVMAQLFVSYSGILSHLGVVSSIDRAGDTGSNGQRLYNWQAAWMAIKAHPWFGEGSGSFYKISIDAMFHTSPASYPKFAEHAHNLPLNLAAELGVPVALVVMLGLGWWFLRHTFAPRLSATRLWALACVSVIGLHSMVEYPLWYTYFIIPFGLCLGVADAEDKRIPVIRIPRWVVVTMSVAGFVVLGWIMHDWMAVRGAYEALNAEEPEVELSTRLKVRDELASVSHYSVFAQIAEGLRLQSWNPEEGGAAEIADRCDRTWQYKPGWYLMMRCGEAYAMAGREALLDRIARAGCDGFPKYQELLSNWARGVDEDEIASVKILGRACLK